MDRTEETTLDCILDAACSEFLAKGFQGASLRSIAKRAGVTTGAFYGYFKSKEELFDALVGEQYAHLIEMYRNILHQFTQLSPEKQCCDMQKYTNCGIASMTEYIYDHFVPFKLILCCSEGTMYENLVHNMSQMDCDATQTFLKTMEDNGVPVRGVHPQLEHMLISGMFSAYFELVVHDIPKENAEEYVNQLSDFYTAGWQKIMGL